MQTADWIWLLTIAGLLTADAVLHETGRPLLTDEARKHKAIAFGVLGVFSLHVLDVLGPLDPFRAVSRFL